MIFGRTDRRIDGSKAKFDVQVAVDVRLVAATPKPHFGRPNRRFGRPKRRFGHPKRRFGRPKRRFGCPKRRFGHPKRPIPPIFYTPQSPSVIVVLGPRVTTILRCDPVAWCIL